jgi:hypothetical protein
LGDLLGTLAPEMLNEMLWNDFFICSISLQQYYRKADIPVLKMQLL